MPNPSDHPALEAYNSDEPVCEKCGARVSVDFALCGRCVDLERAEAERDALQHIIDCADTPLMRDVMAARDQAKAKLTRAETAFGILSDSHPDEAQEAWRKAGELCGGAG